MTDARARVGPLPRFDYVAADGPFWRDRYLLAFLLPGAELIGSHINRDRNFGVGGGCIYVTLADGGIAV